MLDIMMTVIICSLIGSLVLTTWIIAWGLFEDTELWEIIKDKITRKEQ